MPIPIGQLVPGGDASQQQQLAQQMAAQNAAMQHAAMQQQAAAVSAQNMAPVQEQQLLAQQQQQAAYRPSQPFTMAQPGTPQAAALAQRMNGYMPSALPPQYPGNPQLSYNVGGQQFGGLQHYMQPRPVGQMPPQAQGVPQGMPFAGWTMNVNGRPWQGQGFPQMPVFSRMFGGLPPNVQAFLNQLMQMRGAQ